jgi:hypothetical protein
MQKKLCEWGRGERGEREDEGEGEGDGSEDEGD